MSLIVYIGDAEDVLKVLPSASIDCVITSPPYWKQRDYKHPKQIGQESSYLKYVERLVEIFTELKRVLKPAGTFFLNIGYKYEDKDLLLIPELVAMELQKRGWCLINKIIWFKPNAMPSSLSSRFSNVYEPIFLFVKEESKYRYFLSLDNLRIPSQDFDIDKKPDDLIGMEVRNSLIKEGLIKGVVKSAYKNKDGIILAEVIWENGRGSVEIVNDFKSESQIEVKLICQGCNGVISHYIELEGHSRCPGFPLPLLQPQLKPEKVGQQIPLLPWDLTLLKDYQGKYKLSPESRGASPGVRLALFGEYLVVQRRFRVLQPLIADYLRFWRNKRGIPIKEIDKILGYKDTAGHWFRKDTGSWGKGGSIPLPEDWFNLKKILQFDDIYDRWVTETHLVLQTVKPHPKGKNPGDVWSINTQPITEAHFAVFPEELVRRCIEAGCPKGGIVLDPFAGSGTTGKVARDLGRDAILIELKEEYLDIIRKRCGDIDKVIYVK